MTKNSKTNVMGRQYRRASELPGMGGFNHTRTDMTDILDVDVIILAAKIVSGKKGKFAIMDIEIANGEIYTAICGGENVVRLIRKWEETSDLEPIIVKFGKVVADSGNEVYTVE